MYYVNAMRKTLQRINMEDIGFLGFCLLLCFETGSCYIAQAGLASASLVLGLEACVTTSS
jgi:hypothetical protein